MIKFRSLNGRLLFAFASLSIIVCLFFIRLSTLFIENAELNAYQSLLIAEAKLYSQREKKEHYPTVEQRAHFIKIYDDSVTVPDKFISYISKGTSGSFTLKTGDFYMYQKAYDHNNNERILLLNISMLKANQHLSGFKSLFLYSISVSVILLSLLSSWYLAKWLSMPIRKLTLDIDRRTNGQESFKFGLSREDEIGKLALALDQSYEKIQTLLKREQNFTRDVSHELRTPITLIKNTIALSTEKRLDSEETKVVSQASKELEQTVEVLLALARQENLHFKVQTVLPIIEKTVLNIYNIYPDSDFDVTIKVDAKLQVTGNQYLISLLCQNLVNNGFYHSNSAGMKIYSKENTLIFENKIKGDMQRPFYQGLGHGQYLVNRIAEEMGWGISINQIDGVYSVIVQTI